eukprot:scaffold44835_cov14-Tisochrysis_lutea.AAC.1
MVTASTTISRTRSADTRLFIRLQSKASEYERGEDKLQRIGERDCLHPPVQEASKVAVQALIAGDELIGEGKARHEATLLQPEDGAEGAREEDALHAGKSNQALVEML